MVVCDPCSKGEHVEQHLRATRRIHVHKLNEDGLEGFSTKTFDLCEVHYQEVLVPLFMSDSKEDSKS